MQTAGPGCLPCRRNDAVRDSRSVVDALHETGAPHRTALPRRTSVGVECIEVAAAVAEIRQPIDDRGRRTEDRPETGTDSNRDPRERQVSDVARAHLLLEWIEPDVLRSAMELRPVSLRLGCSIEQRGTRGARAGRRERSQDEQPPGEHARPRAPRAQRDRVETLGPAAILRRPCTCFHVRSPGCPPRACSTRLRACQCSAAQPRFTVRRGAAGGRARMRRSVCSRHCARRSRRRDAGPGRARAPTWPSSRPPDTSR